MSDSFRRLPLRLRVVGFFGLASLVVLAYTIFGRLVVWLGLVPFPRWRRMAMSRLCRSWNRTLFGLARCLGLVELAVEGEVPVKRPLLVVSNHQSLLDIPVLQVALGRRQLIRYVVKRELKWFVPSISPSCRAAGYAFVDRRSEAWTRNLAELTRFARRLGTDEATGVIFPEGTWEPRGRPLPFKAAGLKTILKEAPLDVLPVVVEGTWKVQSVSDLINGLGGIKARVLVGELIPAAEARRDPDALIARLEALVHGRLAEMRTVRTQQAGASA